MSELFDITVMTKHCDIDYEQVTYVVDGFGALYVYTPEGQTLAIFPARGWFGLKVNQ